MVLVALPAIATIIASVLSLFGVILKNKFLVVIGALIFLYMFSGMVTLPPFIWIGIVVVMFFTIIGGGK